MGNKKPHGEFVKEIHLKTPPTMQYYVSVETDKERHKFISRVEKVVRGSLEYKEYIKFLKEHMNLDSCIFFQAISSSRKDNGGKHASVELHHEPFTLYDIVSVIVAKYKDQGQELNDLLIADEVMQLHYDNKVGLVPLSKTAHQMIHNSTKLMVPLNMCYGNYSDFLEEYEPWIDDGMYTKLEKKLIQTENLTEDSFNALVKEFTYLDVKGFEDAEKMELTGEESPIAAA